MKLKEKFQRFWTLSKSHKGFTLVELIVVIAILAILAGVAIPVYNGYIKKAQEAADQQLLDSINTAFAAACLSNGMDHTLAVGDITINDDGTIAKPVQTASAAPTTAAYWYFNSVIYGGQDVKAVVDPVFAMFYAGNEGAKFSEGFMEKNGKTLTVTGSDDENAGSQTFEYTLADGTKVTLNVSAADVAKLKDSTYNTIGMSNLMTELDKVVGIASGLGNGRGGAAFENVLGTDEYKNAAWAALGVTTQEEYDTAVNGLVGNLMEKGMSMDDAVNQIETMGAVLYTAKQTAGMTVEEATALFNGASVEGIITSMSNTESGAEAGKGLAQAALVCGMYSAYTNGEKDVNILNVTNALENDAGFKQYLESDKGKADLQGYLGALSMIDSSLNSPDATKDVIANGFGDSDLANALEQLGLKK